MPDVVKLVLDWEVPEGNDAEKLFVEISEVLAAKIHAPAYPDDPPGPLHPEVKLGVKIDDHRMLVSIDPDLIPVEMIWVIGQLLDAVYETDAESCKVYGSDQL